MKSKQGIYHIHVDATHLSLPAENFLVKRAGFTETAFTGHAEGALHFEMPKHFTFKTTIFSDFDHRFSEVQGYFSNNVDSIAGYLEGEYVPLDLDLEAKPFDDSVPLPFLLKLNKLEPGTFREDEIHITLDRELSSPKLLENLRNMGFFSAYINKPQCNVEIFTAQGSKKNIKLILMQVKDYLSRAGGAVGGSIKEEMILKWWLSDRLVNAPPVATIAAYE